MRKGTINRKGNVGQANGTAATHSERAKSDGAFRERPLWRVRQRPDMVWGPALTLSARQLLKEERTHVSGD